MYQEEVIKQPPFLQEGDKVALISPAYWIDEIVLQQAAEIIKSWGLVPIIGKNTNKQDVDAYAGTANDRAEDLRWALEDDDIKAIICSRGGYGAIHLLNRIPLALYNQHPKWLVGHGDITILLSALNAASIMSIHGPMALQIAGGLQFYSNQLRDLLFGIVPKYEIPGNKNNHPGRTTGHLVGGNLSSFSALAGTRYHISPEHNIILFIEEVEESLHDIDRLFYMLRLQGDLERVTGIILGEFFAVRYDLQYDSVEEMLSKHIQDPKIPVCCGFPAGSNSFIPLIMGAPVELEVTPDNSTLTFQMSGEQHYYWIDKSEKQLLK